MVLEGFSQYFEKNFGETTICRHLCVEYYCLSTSWITRFLPSRGDCLQHKVEEHVRRWRARGQFDAHMQRGKRTETQQQGEIARRGL